jgi:phosphoribosyl-ATP pyrophosphohydrolase/phosphoribosyl-AMP cyclohydrolase/histidinol dehydrogenase
MTALRLVPASAVAHKRRDALDPSTLAGAAAIVADVEQRGEPALRAHGERLGDLAPGAPLVRTRRELEAALHALPSDQRDLLLRTRDRIAAFAARQLQSLAPFQMDVAGGRAGQYLAPVERAGCYAPGGRYPLPSSVLMGAVTARVAGVREVWVASPHPQDIVLAAAGAAGADALLAAGGAQAIAALAHGAGPVPACDAVVGPGNAWVTAAKQLVAGRVAIDMLAGPSELVVLADDSADPAMVAADLLAQAEHDVQALPVLVSTSIGLIEAVNRELEAQLRDLPTAETARAALASGFAVHAAGVDEALAVCDRLAPEHLQILARNAKALAPRLSHYGALFVGPRSAEVLGDYGAGPNHVLPTGGTARSCGGLSVFTFLRVRTWLELGAGSADLARDAAQLARLEGLEAHARAAERRLG